jgi:ABC-type phosphate/phosphonate transport system substrate-binding protein
MPSFDKFYKELKGKEPSGELWEAYKRVLATSSAMQRMIVFPPNVPPQAMKAVRDAIRDFEKDPDYAAEAEKLVGFVPDYETGDDVQEDVRRALTIKDEERDWLMNYAARNGKG